MEEDGIHVVVAAAAVGSTELYSELWLTLHQTAKTHRKTSTSLYVVKLKLVIGDQIIPQDFCSFHAAFLTILKASVSCGFTLKLDFSGVAALLQTYGVVFLELFVSPADYLAGYYILYIMKKDSHGRLNTLSIFTLKCIFQHHESLKQFFCFFSRCDCAFSTSVYMLNIQ